MKEGPEAAGEAWRHICSGPVLNCRIKVLRFAAGLEMDRFAADAVLVVKEFSVRGEAKVADSPSTHRSSRKQRPGRVVEGPALRMEDPFCYCQCSTFTVRNNLIVLVAIEARVHVVGPWC